MHRYTTTGTPLTKQAFLKHDYCSHLFMTLLLGPVPAGNSVTGPWVVLTMTIEAAGIAKLYSAERPRLARLVQRIVGNHGTADELVHDAFSNLLSATRRTRVEQPEAYLTRAARNLALNHLRHFRQGIELSIDQEVYQAIADTRPSPEMEVLYRQQLHRLLVALAALPQRRREVFILHRFQGLGYGEIASQLGLSRRTVINHVFNALDGLDLALGPDFMKL